MQMLPCAHHGRNANIAVGRFSESVHGAVEAAVLKIEARVLKMATQRWETSFTVYTLERKLMFNARRLRHSQLALAAPATLHIKQSAPPSHLQPRLR